MEGDDEVGEVVRKALPPNRNVKEDLKFQAPPKWKLIFHWLSICGYFVAYALDVILLYQLCTAGDWLYFVATLIFILLPTIIVTLFSLQMLKQKLNNGEQIKKRDLIGNCCFVGPVLRYWNCIKYHKDAIHGDDVEGGQTERRQYYEEVRDVDFLAFIYAFLEGGPQLTIQVYILLMNQLIPNSNSSLTYDHIWSILKVIVSAFLIAKSMACYKSSLRVCHGTNFQWYVLVFQMVYRLVLLISRVMVISLFATAYGFYVLIFICVHFLIMFFIPNTEEFFKDSKILNHLLKVVLNIIFIFCHITRIAGETLVYQSIFYFLTIVENIVMIIMWTFNNGRHLDTYEIVAMSIVFSTMFISILMLVIFYVWLHPSKKREQADDENTELVTTQLSIG